MDHIVELQKQIKSIVVDQMKQQHDFREKTIQKGKRVKLPKIDIVTISGNNLKWTEFWDSFECAIRKNKKTVKY